MTRAIHSPAVLCLAAMLCGASPPPASKPVTSSGQRPFADARAPMKARRPLHRPHTVLARPLPPILRDVTVANRDATREPVRQAFIDAVQIFPYSEGALYHVYAAPGLVTDIALEPGETLGSVAAGDTVRWVIGDTTSGAGPTKRTHLLVKPFTPGLSTNLVITTDRHVYHLAATSTARTAMAVLSWTYPQDALLALRQDAGKADTETPVAAGLDLEQLHFNYRVSGDTVDWRPLRAFDDGRQTLIEFPATIATGEAPPLFLVGPKGDAELVNYRVHGHFYVVDRLFDAAELRLGLKPQQIVRITRVTESGARPHGGHHDRA